MTMTSLFFPACAVVFILGTSCSSIENVKQSVCFDGWTTDNSGGSKIWNAPNNILESLYLQLPKSRQIVCVHQMPSNKLFVVNVDVDKIRLTTTFNLIEGEYFAGDESVIVSSKH